MLRFVSVWQWYVFAPSPGLSQLSLLRGVLQDDSDFFELYQMGFPQGKTWEYQLTESLFQDLAGLGCEPRLPGCWVVAIRILLCGSDRSLPSAFSSALHLSDKR